MSSFLNKSLILANWRLLIYSLNFYINPDSNILITFFEFKEILDKNAKACLNLFLFIYCASFYIYLS